MMDPDGRRLGDLGSRVIPAAGGVGVIALGAGLLMGFMGEGKEQFFRSYLMAFEFVLSICLGALFFVILQHCVKAGWSVVIRRLAEGVASNLMWLWIAFIPILIGMKQGLLYDWVNHPGEAEKYRWWLTPEIWSGRAMIYLFIWAFLAWFYMSNSVKQDSTGDVNITRRMERFAPVAVGLYFVTQAFSSLDWVMSLESMWFSTMFPVYFFAASCCGYFSFQILAMATVQKGGKLLHEITPEHYQDAGKLLFAFGIVFWSYIAFSQYMLIWYANIPEETTWYMARQMGGWGTVTLALLFGHFVIPFVLLISRHPKRQPQMLALGAVLMLTMHFVDIAWLVKPHVPEHLLHDAASYAQLAKTVTAADVGYVWSLFDALLPIGLLGLIIAGTAIRLRGVALIPERDPRLHESLAFENI